MEAKSGSHYMKTSHMHRWHLHVNNNNNKTIERKWAKYNCAAINAF